MRKSVTGFIAFSYWAMALLIQMQPVHASSAEILSGTGLKTFISGKRIYLKAPLGGELPLYYRADGIVNGSGAAVGLGRFMAPKDSGRWWVAKNKICQKWATWYNGKTFCFTLTKLSNSRVLWKRDDGAEGISRIGR
jgi:hypothetical protein